jgi:hypothetical protein
MEVRMVHFEKSQGRREFLRKGILGGFVVATFPLLGPFQSAANQSKSIPLNHQYLQDESHRKLLKIVKRYGGEFGDRRGGL